MYCEKHGLGREPRYQQLPLYEGPPSGDQLEFYGRTPGSFPQPQQWPPDEAVGEGEIPLEDPAIVSDAAGAVSIAPSAPPPIDEMAEITGYEQILSPTVTFVAPPPSYQEAAISRALESFEIGDRLMEEKARELLLEHAKSRCCWGSWAAQEMRFKSLQQSTAVHYVLRTFLETRATDWASEPFRGQVIDGPQNGAPPAPWDIEVETPDVFHDAVIHQEVPHTASVRSCYGCQGAGRLRCSSCSGWGRNRCYSCQGTGQIQVDQQQEVRNRCVSCEGSGHRRCVRCSGRGRVACGACDSAGQLRCFVKLTVTFRTHVRDFILESTALPNELIRKVPGTTLFEDTQPLLSPIQTFPEQHVNIQSANLIQEHRGLAQTGRILRQNHVIRGVPVFQCDCAWKDKEFQFFVYGDNSRVYTNDYPQTCCCCRCQLL